MAFSVEDLVLSTPWIEATGDAALDGTTATFDIEAEASDLTPLGAALDRPISGAARLYASGTAQTDGSGADVTLDWHPGGHEVRPEELSAAKAFLAHSLPAPAQGERA